MHHFFGRAPAHLAARIRGRTDAMLIVDMLGTIRHSNARALALFGMPRMI